MVGTVEDNAATAMEKKKITLYTIYYSIPCVTIVCRYAASMWTISINSAINTGENAHYDESCSSTLASTFSNGAKDPNTGVATTDLYGKCTRTHSGTSAAAPEAAGVFALALDAK